jgi:hypothetical protein
MPTGPEHDATLLLRPFSCMSAGGPRFNRLRRVGSLPHLPCGTKGRVGTPTGWDMSPWRGHG